MRPRVVTYNLASVDGRLTIAPGVNLMAGDARWNAVIAGIGDPYADICRVVDPQLLLEGSGSFVTDPAAPVEVPDPVADHVPEGEHFLPDDVIGVPGRRWFGVVDGRGRVDLQFTEWPDPAWAGWHALVLTSLAASEKHLQRLKDRGIPFVVVGEQHVHLPTALSLLADRLGIRTVVCTGGGRLGGAMLRAGLIDEIDIDVLPVAIGGRGTPALFDAAPLRPDEWPVQLELLSAERLDDGRLRLRYAVIGPVRPS